MMEGKIVSHYEIIEKIGSGGMGVVYRAHDIKLNRFVALKFLPHAFSLNEEVKKRFIHEAQAASSLQHNNICNIHEIDEAEDGKIFICMDYYVGESLRKKINKGPLEIEEALEITLQIADGLSKAHDKNIIHRDIKPENIFITEEGIVKILDFGLAKAPGQTQLTQLGHTVGTISYMSPEQTRGEKVDHKSDIWSLGVILYEMIAGSLPFKGDYEQAIIYSILNETPISIKDYSRDISIPLIQIIEKILQKDQKARYNTVDDLINEIENIYSDKRSTKRNLRTALNKIPRTRKLVYLLLPLFIFIVFLAIYFLSGGESLSKPVPIALLPLKNINIENEELWFTEGMTDALITDLAKIGGLRIISRSSVMKYRNSDKSTSEIAAELGVQYLIDGSILKTKDQIRINTRLIDGETDEYVWAEEYNEEFKDILNLHATVAKEIANNIRVKLSPQEKLLLSEKKEIDPAAYEAYLKGKFNLWKLSKEGFESALSYFKLAVELEPEYAEAYAGITLAWRSQAQMGFLPFQTVIDKSKDAATKALSLDSNLAEIHFMNAVNYTWGQWEWELAGKEFEKTLKLNPNMAEAHAYYSQFLFLIDRPEEGLEHIRLAKKLDPYNKLFQALYAMDLMYVKRYDELIELLENVLKDFPDEYMALSTLRSAYHQKKMYDKAIQMWTRSFDLRKDLEAREVLTRGYEEGGYSIALLRVAELMVKRSESGSYVTPWQIATLYTRAGKKKEALNWFEKAFKANDPNMPYLKVDPIFDILYDEPRFKQILENMNLSI